MVHRQPKIHYGRSCAWAKHPNAKIAEDPADADCPVCRRWVEKHNLRPRWVFPESDPVSFVGTWRSKHVWKRPGEKIFARYLTFVCPCCGKTNWHGGPGHKAPHCECWRPNGGYTLEDPDGNS